MKINIIKFQGGYGAEEMLIALNSFKEVDAKIIWSTSKSIPECDLLVIPGGATFLDIFRPGALAKASRMGHQISQFADSGGKILGVGNGFQILTELSLLPGGFTKNNLSSRLNKNCFVTTYQKPNGLCKNFIKDAVYNLPITSTYFNYIISKTQLEDLENYNGVTLRFCTDDGEVDETSSPQNIAGIINKNGNILATLLRPEKAFDPLHRTKDGKEFLSKILSALN